MYIVRLVFINMESEDHKFVTKKEAEEFLDSTLSSEQNFCSEITKPIFTKLHTYNSQVRTIMLLEEIGENMTCLERYDLQLCFERTI